MLPTGAITSAVWDVPFSVHWTVLSTLGLFITLPGPSVFLALGTTAMTSTLPPRLLANSAAEITVLACAI